MTNTMGRFTKFLNIDEMLYGVKRFSSGRIFGVGPFLSAYAEDHGLCR
jgi:hypothetical protein